MHAIMNITSAAAAELAAEWQSEHDGYYGRPHGARTIDLDIPEYRVPEWAVRYDCIACGLHSHESQRLWMRSSGAWLLCDLVVGTLEVAGRRGSITERMPQEVIDAVSGYIYLDTQRPDLAPWETSRSVKGEMELIAEERFARWAERRGRMPL